MSERNVDVIRRLHAAYDEGDYEAIFDCCTADVHWCPDAAVFPGAKPMVGLKQLRSWFAEIAAAWVQVRFPISEASEVGDDRVLMRGEWGGKGVASGVETFSSVSAVYTVEHGRISKAEQFFDHERAL